MKAKREVEQLAKFVDLIDYQEGSVISRTMIDEKAGTVTMFAFDEGGD